MRTSLERSAAISRAASERAWLEIETLIEAAQESLAEIRAASTNGDRQLAQSVNKILENERQKIRGHRGVEPTSKQPQEDEATEEEVLSP